MHLLQLQGPVQRLQLGPLPDPQAPVRPGALPDAWRLPSDCSPDLALPALTAAQAQRTVAAVLPVASDADAPSALSCCLPPSLPAYTQCSADGSCKQCLTQTTCLRCNDGWYLNAATKKCVPCKGGKGCGRCDKMGTCQVCKEGFLFKSATKTCDAW